MSPNISTPGSAISPEILAPTRLYRLEPFGLGTPQVEGLDSYFIRLAAAHCVSPRDLLRYELVPTEPALQGTLHSNFPARFAKTINGLGPYAAGISGALNQLTGRNDLSRLTLLPWNTLFTANGAGLLTNVKRWCPACLAEHRLAGIKAYRPLAWSFDLFTACPTHGLSLAHRCPRCKKTQSHLPRTPVLDLCEYCHCYIGLDVVSTAASPQAIRVSEELLGLLTHAPIHPLENLRRHLRRLIKEEANGNRDAFARQYGLDKELLKNWFNKPCLPALPSLIQVGARIGVRATEVISKRRTLVKLPPFSIGPLKPRAERRRASDDDLDSEKTALQSLLANPSTPSLADAAKALGLSASTLRYRFPLESAALIKRRNQSLGDFRRQKLFEIDNAILSSMRSIAVSGKSVSRRRVEQQLRRHQLSLWQSNVRARYLALRSQSEPF